MKIVVYTCITGGYDNLMTPKVKTEGVDYICFTDDDKMKNDIWQIRPMPEDVKGLSNVKQQRMVKILPHKYLPEYDVSIWVDGAVDVKGDIKEFLESIKYNEDGKVFIPKHPVRDCIYKEAEVVKKIGKDRTEMPDKQMKKYKEEGFPQKYGLVQSNIMIRWHNDEECKKLMECWAGEVRELSHRDQLSFNYAVWKTKASCFRAIDKKTCDSKWFKWIIAHKNSPKRTVTKPTVKAQIEKALEQKPAPVSYWKEKFDKIICIHYMPHMNRLAKCRQELDRVGILKSGAFGWKITYDSPIFDKLYEVCHRAPSVGCMKVGFAHYEAIKECYELGMKRILILENDNIFLKSTEDIERIVKNMPDSDIVLFDKIPAASARYADAVVNNKINDDFIDIGKKFYVMANCYSLSRKGMEHVIKNQERELAISDTYLRFNTNAIEEEGLTRAAAITSIAIQNPDFEPESENAKLHKNMKGINSNIDDYKKLGVRFDLYNQ